MADLASNSIDFLDFTPLDLLAITYHNWKENIMNYKYLKNFYQAYYPNDNVGEEIRSKATFEGLFENIQNCYRYIGVLDSVIRERLFAQLARIKGVDYEEIYNLYFKGR